MGADIEAKRQREKAMVNEMIALYCRKKHGTRGGLCPDCAALAAYARHRHVMETNREKRRLEELG